MFESRSTELTRLRGARTAMFFTVLTLGVGGCAAPEGQEMTEDLEFSTHVEDLRTRGHRGHDDGAKHDGAKQDAVAKANRVFCPKNSHELRLKLRGVKLERLGDIPLQYEGFNNIEGPLWHDGALYYTNMGNRTDEDGTLLTNQTTLWRWEPGADPEIWLEDTVAGTNGLAVNFKDELIAARQLDGSISKIDWDSKAISTLTDVYEDRRFNSPNDLTIAHDDTIYFSDPNWNVPSTVDPESVQGGGAPGSLEPGQRVYRLGSDGIVWPLVATELVPELRDKPNGVMLSIDEKQLLIGSMRGLWVFDLEGGQVKNPLQLLNTGVDGMGKDCAGNIYVTTSRPVGDREDGQVVVVLDPQYEELGQLEVPFIQGVTNVAFGGEDRKTLYVTGLTDPLLSDGTTRLCGGRPCAAAGIYAARLNVPGFPY